MEQVKTITLPLDAVKEWRDKYLAHDASYAMHMALVKVIDAALWTPPVTDVQWIECKDHPRPANKKVMYQYPDTTIVVDSFGKTGHVGRWAILKGID